MLSYKLRKGTVPVTETTLYKVFEAAKNNGANTEFYFMETEERVFLKDVWAKVRNNLDIHKQIHKSQDAKYITLNYYCTEIFDD